MKRLLYSLFFLSLETLAWGGAGNQAGLVVSSGTYQTISTYANDDGGNRQSIIIGNRTSSATLTVDNITGIPVALSTSALTQANGIQSFTMNTTTVTFNGSAQPVSQSGVWTVQQSTIGVVSAAPLTVTGSTVGITGSISNTGFNVNNTPAVTQSGVWTIQQSTIGVISAAPLTVTGSTVGITGSISNTGFNVNNTPAVSQSGIWTIQQSTIGVISAAPLTVTGSTVGITGSISNTSFAATQTTNANLRASVAIDGSSNAVTVTGIGASGATAAGNPVRMGGIGRTTYQTAVTDGQTVDAQCDSEGKCVFMPYAIPALSTSGVTAAAMTGTSQVVLVSSGGANINTYITVWSCTNSHATVGTFVYLRNAQTLRWPMYVAPAGGGFVHPFPTPLAGAGNSQWSVENVTTGSNVMCGISGYFAKN